MWGFVLYKTLTMKQEKIDMLKEFAQLLKDNGFTVLIDYKHPFRWVYFMKDGRFGDVQDSFSFGFNFGTAHIPCKSHGTGLQTASNVDLTIQNATDAVNAKGWSYTQEIKHYQSVDEFIRRKNKDGFSEFYVL